MKIGNLEFESQPEPGLFKAPMDFDFQAACDKATQYANNYTVAFMLDGEVFGSGTLVTVKGMHGILTAHHVMRVPEQKRREEFGLCIYAKRHRVEVNLSQYHHFVLGDSRRHFGHSGPDLSFVMFTDKGLCSTLLGIKSFYPLMEQCDISAFPAAKLRQIPWFVSGSPGALTETVGTHRGDIVTKVAGRHYEAHFHALRKNDGFDYLRFQVHSGVEDWPETYGGVSGGGIWILSADVTGNSELDFPATLQGVVFCQSRSYMKNTRRLLIGHGPQSIYRRLVEAL